MDFKVIKVSDEKGKLVGFKLELAEESVLVFSDQNWLPGFRLGYCFDYATREKVSEEEVYVAKGFSIEPNSYTPDRPERIKMMEILSKETVEYVSFEGDSTLYRRLVLNEWEKRTGPNEPWYPCDLEESNMLNQLYIKARSNGRYVDHFPQLKTYPT